MKRALQHKVDNIDRTSTKVCYLKKKRNEKEKQFKILKIKYKKKIKKNKRSHTPRGIQ